MRGTRPAEVPDVVSALNPPGRLVLAPMEGVADDILRDVLTRVGGWDWCVTEFVRVNDQLLPDKAFLRRCPELLHDGRTPAGTLVRVQLLGSDPERLAENAARVASMGTTGVDLNFGCPAPTVNRHRGGAALLNEPELLHDIVKAVRAAVPRPLLVTAKMRLGLADTDRALDCARALDEGGADELVVHARTKVDGYKPPARWEWIPRIREVVTRIPVIANGEVWTVADYHAIRAATGSTDVMIGRGAVADPHLARRIRGERAPTPGADDWTEIEPLLVVFWEGVRAKVKPADAPGRLKMWLNALRRTYPQAEALFTEIRRETDPLVLDRRLGVAVRPAA